jgi:outer membrane protein TolC
LFGKQFVVVAALLVSWPAAAEEPEGDAVGSAGRRAPTELLLASLEEPALRELAAEVLERNPTLAAARARSRAAFEVAPQHGALPDPTAMVTAFLATPETRTGPQRLAASIAQPVPWKGKRALRRDAALEAAAALEAEEEVQRLALVLEVRRLYYELAFLDRQQEITDEFRAHLLQHEEIARSRYATGVGLGQGVVKLQAAVTRVDRDLLEIDTRRVALVTQVNALRNRPAMATLPAPRNGLLPELAEISLEVDDLVEEALRVRPELASLDARIARQEALVRLAEKGSRPDFQFGLTFTLVDDRDDVPGRLQPPQGNGKDVFGIQGGLTLPVWRGKIEAGVQEALDQRTAVEESRRTATAGIRAAVGNAAHRLRLTWRRARLIEDLLIVQAEEALESAKAAYVAGTLNALDLLDAEHVLFEAHTALARARTDYRLGIAELEAAIAGPLRGVSRPEE